MNLTDGMSSVCKMHAFFAFKGLGYSVNTAHPINLGD